MYKLFPRPSFLEGIARTIDYDDNLVQCNFSSSAQEADGKALFFDFYAIGTDIIQVLDTHYTHEQKEKA